jgi:hypothetical protein
MIYNDHNWDQQAETDYEKYGGEPRVQKIEECVPYEESDIDTNEDYLNYEDPEWTKDDMRWTQEEKEKKVETKEEGIPF